MNAHSRNEHIVAAACGTIWNLAMNDEYRETLAHHKVIESLVAVIALHPGNTVIQFRAITALFKLSTYVPNDIVAGGGVEHMINACHKDTNNVYLIANVLGALWNIAMISDDNRRIVGKHLDDILQCMRKHLENNEVKHRSATLLFHLFQVPNICQNFVGPVTNGNSQLGLRIILEMLHGLCTSRIPGEHSETVYLFLTCIILLFKNEAYLLCL
jgi:hypothetical protein